MELEMLDCVRPDVGIVFNVECDLENTASVNMIDSNISSSNNGVSPTAKSETHLPMATPRTTSSVRDMLDNRAWLVFVSQGLARFPVGGVECNVHRQRSRPESAVLDEGKQNLGGDDKVGLEAGICLNKRVDATGH
jgi:hypothetical protein